MRLPSPCRHTPACDPRDFLKDSHPECWATCWRNKSLRLLLKNFKHYISTVTIPKEDHQNLLFLLISLQHKREKIKFRSCPCFLSSPTLIVSGNGCALKGGEATAKPLVRRIRVVVSSCVYDLNQNRGQKHQKKHAQKELHLGKIDVNMSVEMPHYQFFGIIGNESLWKRPFLARQVSWAKLAYKHCNSRTLESTETLQLWDVNDVKQACFRAS